MVSYGVVGNICLCLVCKAYYIQYLVLPVVSRRLVMISTKSRLTFDHITKLKLTVGLDERLKKKNYKLLAHRLGLGLRAMFGMPYPCSHVRVVSAS
jgi:hypothetical protein